MLRSFIADMSTRRRQRLLFRWTASGNRIDQPTLVLPATASNRLTVSAICDAPVGWALLSFRRPIAGLV